jgi:LPXTG-site transpeptidase (sortase) family protein
MSPTASDSMNMPGYGGLATPVATSGFDLSQARNPGAAEAARRLIAGIADPLHLAAGQTAHPYPEAATTPAPNAVGQAGDWDRPVAAPQPANSTVMPMPSVASAGVVQMSPDTIVPVIMPTANPAIDYLPALPIVPGYTPIAAPLVTTTIAPSPASIAVVPTPTLPATPETTHAPAVDPEPADVSATPVLSAAAPTLSFYALPATSPLATPTQAPGTMTAMAPATTAPTATAAAVAKYPVSSRSRTMPRIPSSIMPIATAIGSFGLLIVLLRSQVIFSQLQYLSAKPAVVTTQPTTPTAEVVPAGSVLNIPKINVSAPILLAASNEESAFQKDLQNGVVHYANTSLPGENGNTVIFGHSSNDWWEPGSFKFVFVLLDKLVAGDTFSVNYQQKKYTYEVTEVRVVEPTDLSVLRPTTIPTISIITCTPPGTSWKRLVVVAKQISPAPAQLSVTAPIPEVKPTPTLPGNAPSFAQQISTFWNSLWGKK